MKPMFIICVASSALALTAPVKAQTISLASAPPVVVKTVPTAGATDVDPTLTEIKVTYSKAMQDGSWSWSTWGEENYPETTGSPRYLQDGRTCVLSVKLQPNKFYALWLNSDKFKNFTDTSGRPAVPYLLTFYTGEAASSTTERDQTGRGEQYLQQQLKLAQAGNYWAKFHLWEAYAKGKHDVDRNSAEANKWLSELAKEAYLAKFEPVDGFNPQTPKEMLNNFNKYCRLFSGRDSLGGASFFRTTKQGDKLIGSFLTATPDDFKAALEKNPNLKLVSMAKVTPEMFLAHEAAKQESL